MAPSGEAFFTKDRFGVVRQHRRLGAHEPVEVNQGTVDWVVHQYGYERVDREVANWAEVEAFVDGATTKTTILAEDLPVNVVIARSAVRVLARWLTSPADVQLVVPTVNRLLSEVTVRADEELTKALLSLSSQAAETFGARGAAPLLRSFSSAEGRPGRRQQRVNEFFSAQAA